MVCEHYKLATNQRMLSHKRILIVDDCPIVVAGLQAVLGKMDSFCLCPTASSNNAVRMSETHNPDLVIIEIYNQRGDGNEIIRKLKNDKPHLRILAYSQCDEWVYAPRALKAGASGYLMKNRPLEDLINAIQSVLQGDLYILPQIAIQILGCHVTPPTNISPQRTAAFEKLTDREIQILELLGSGMGTLKIAKQLFVSPKTVYAHRNNIINKLNLDSSSELVRIAKDWVDSCGPRISLQGYLGDGPGIVQVISPHLHIANTVHQDAKV